MKWLKVFLVVFLLLLLSVVSPFLVMAESVPPTYPELLSELTEIWKELNQISVTSEVTLISMQEKWPSLVQKVEDFGNKLKTFEIDQANMSENMKGFNQSFNISVMELTTLKNQYAGVLSSVETLRTSFMNIEEEVKSMQKKSNIGLGVSIMAAIIGAIALGYSLFGANR